MSVLGAVNDRPDPDKDGVIVMTAPARPFRFPTTLCVLLMVLLVAACGDASPAATPAVESEATAPDTANSTPTSSASASPTPAATSTEQPSAGSNQYGDESPTGSGSPTAAMTPSPASTPSPTETSPTEATEVTVDIVDFFFDQAEITIPVGTTVVWTNVGPTPHTTTSRDRLWDSGIMQQGDTFSFTFDTPGSYEYWCTLHPNMVGTVVVE